MYKYNNISLTTFPQSKYKYFPRWKVIVKVTMDVRATPTLEPVVLFPNGSGGQMRKVYATWDLLDIVLPLFLSLYVAI
jgi:hypothetical protein